MHQQGDLVSAPTDALFGDYLLETENLEYICREKIYGVVTHANETEGVHYMRWGVEGMSNISPMEWEVLNLIPFRSEELELLRSKDDPAPGVDLHIKLFSEHVGSGWRYKYRPARCNIRGCSGHCSRTIRAYRMPMLHLILDLH